MFTKKRKAVPILMLCFLSLFVGCRGPVPSDPLPPVRTLPLQSLEDPPQSAIPETALPESLCPVSTEEKVPAFSWDDVLFHGKDLVLYGTLRENAGSSEVLSLETVLDSFSGTVSVMIVSADHEKALSYNTEERLFCACTVKAAYCLYACLEIEKQGISLDTPLTYLASHYESGTGDMQYSPVGTVFSLEKTLFKTMSISDNVGYRMLVDFFGREGYNAWIEEMGCDSLKIHPTVWSLSAKAKDLAVVWEKIFEYFQTDTPTARFFKESCTDTDGAYATEALENVSVSHKQGHNSSGKYLAYSDAGILWNGDDPYFYVILTDNPGITAKGKKLMQEVMDPIHHFLFSPS